MAADIMTPAKGLEPLCAAGHATPLRLWEGAQPSAQPAQLDTRAAAAAAASALAAPLRSAMLLGRHGNAGSTRGAPGCAGYHRVVGGSAASGPGSNTSEAERWCSVRYPAREERVPRYTRFTRPAGRWSNFKVADGHYHRVGPCLPRLRAAKHEPRGPAGRTGCPGVNLQSPGSGGWLRPAGRVDIPIPPTPGLPGGGGAPCSRPCSPCYR